MSVHMVRMAFRFELDNNNIDKDKGRDAFLSPVDFISMISKEVAVMFTFAQH